MAFQDIQKERITDLTLTGITAVSDDIIVEPSAKITIFAALTAGTPATGAKVQYTLDLAETIRAGTASWVDAEKGNSTTSFSLTEPAPSNITGVRLNATNGTWKLIVRQGFVR